MTERLESEVGDVFAAWRLALTHATLPTMVHAHDDGSTVLLSNSLTKAIGYSVEEIGSLGDWFSLAGRIGADDVSGHIQRYLASADIEGRPPEDVEIWTASGEKRAWRLFFSPPITWSGKRRIIVAECLDITAERAVSSTLARRVGELEAIYEGVPFGLAKLDRDFCFVHANRSFAEINGIDASNIQGRPYFDLLPNHRAEIEQTFRDVLQTGLAVDAGYLPPLSATSPFREVLRQILPVRDGRGKAYGLLIVLQDVTERFASRRRLEALNRELQETVTRFDLALRAADVVVFAQDRERRFSFISRGGLAGRQDDYVGLKDEDVLPPIIAAQSIPLKEKVLRTGQPAEADHRGPYAPNKTWRMVRVEPQFDASGAVSGLIGATVDISDRKAQEEQNVALQRELAHRSRNLLAVAQSMARHSLLRSGNAAQFVEKFDRRLESLAKSQDALTNNDWTSAPLRDLVDAQLSLAGNRSSRIEIVGPELLLRPAGVQNLGMALHELIVNATEHGALSGPHGSVEITWSVDADAATFTFEWFERGVAPSAADNHRGFGTLILTRVVGVALGGKSTLDYEGDGLHWTLTVPFDEALVAPVS